MLCLTLLRSTLLRLSLLAAAAFASCPGFAQANEPLVPLPNALALEPGKVRLGAKLFDDRRLSRDSSLACATCHNLSQGGVDTRPGSRVLSAGIGSVRHIFNTPTVYNAGLSYRQQWTGGARTLEELVDAVVRSPLVFDTNWSEVLGKLAADPVLAAEFWRAYPQSGLTQATVLDSLALFQRSLITPSRFDRYLRGDAQAISKEEKRGYEQFKAYGCVGCHQGVNVGGNMLQRFGAMKDYFADREKAGLPSTPGDEGRRRVTKREEDLHVFKVPSLRNVGLTAPYFHDGSAATLDEAVDVMFRYQLGQAAPAADRALIVKFLHSLTGEALMTR